jgi:hypothetical protein
MALLAQSVVFSRRLSQSHSEKTMFSWLYTPVLYPLLMLYKQPPFILVITV